VKLFVKIKGHNFEASTAIWLVIEHGQDIMPMNICPMFYKDGATIILVIKADITMGVSIIWQVYKYSFTHTYLLFCPFDIFSHNPGLLPHTSPGPYSWNMHSLYCHSMDFEFKGQRFCTVNSCWGGKHFKCFQATRHYMIIAAALQLLFFTFQNFPFLKIYTKKTIIEIHMSLFSVPTSPRNDCFYNT